MEGNLAPLKRGNQWWGKPALPDREELGEGNRSNAKVVLTTIMRMKKKLHCNKSLVENYDFYRGRVLSM